MKNTDGIDVQKSLKWMCIDLTTDDIVKSGISQFSSKNLELK